MSVPRIVDDPGKYWVSSSAWRSPSAISSAICGVEPIRMALNFVITQAAQGDLQCRAALFAVNFSHPEYMSARGLNVLSKTPHADASRDGG